VALPNRNAYTHLDLLDIDANELRCPDEQVARQMKAHIAAVQAEGDTLGGVITCVIKNVPVGLGEPIFSKLHAQLGHAMLSINSVKGFEYGYGFASCAMKGSEYNDAFVMKDGKVHTHTNFSGGIQGGISNGNDIFFHVAFKPISSIRKTQQTIDTKGQDVSLHIEGRHDVCAVPRAVPIVEAYANIILADAILQAKQSTL
jgi:chorismate synthase